jgi:tetratricopeptide (TPR) repeat protein
MRIKHIILASAVLVSVATFAQKDELKKLRKIYEKDEIKPQDLSEYIAIVNNLMPIATEESDKIYANFYKAMIPVLQSNTIDKTMPPAQMQAAYLKLVNPKAILDLGIGLNATLDYEKKSGKNIYTDDINETVTFLKPVLFDMAVALVEAKQDKQASDLLYGIYLLDLKDQDNLFFAAIYAESALDYDKALEYYTELKRLKYTGEYTLYFAYNATSKIEDVFGKNKTLRDVAVKAGSHTKPREEKTPSKVGEIYKNIAIILIEKGRTEEAKMAVSEAKIANPDDNSLIITEADLYLKLKDFDTYKKLINQALEKNPNDANLIYKLGVVSFQINNLADAEKYYLRVIEIDPKYINAYLSMVDVKLKADKPMVDEMNSLKDSYSDKDNKRYQVLKKNREVLYKSVLPYYEKVYELEPKKDSVIETLLSVYNFLEMTEEYKALKAKQ